MRRYGWILVALILAAFIVAGCSGGSADDGSNGGADVDRDNGQVAEQTPDASDEPDTNGEPSNEKTNLTVFWLDAEAVESDPVLVRAHVSTDEIETGMDGDIDSPAGLAAASLEALLAGPDEATVAAGLTSSIPSRTTLEDIQLEGDIANLYFSEEFEQMGGTFAIGGMLRQVVWTVTEIDGIEGVNLFVDGDLVGTKERPFTGDGFLFETLNRESFLPPGEDND